MHLMNIFYNTVYEYNYTDACYDSNIIEENLE
jgi:hypothetical protein